MGPPQAPAPMGALKRKLCIHYDSGQCRRGADCNFAHGLEELVTGSEEVELLAHRPKTTRMDFSGLDAGRLSRTVQVPEEQVKSLMTEGVKHRLLEVTGAYDLQWVPATCSVSLTGAAAQLEKAEKLLQ